MLRICFFLALSVQATVQAAENFDPDSDCQILRKAMKGLGKANNLDKRCAILLAYTKVKKDTQRDR